MTTRNEAVAQKTGITDTHNLSCLSENQSGLLFEHYAYGGQFVDEYACLRKIGVQIVKKCSGLPLAIKSIGRVLSYQIDEDNWRRILDSDLWECDDNNEIFPALKVSYYSLPSELKPCFLFCSLFPKGSLLEMNEIIYMWIAHGYIQPCDSRRVEDLGNEFIHELCRRSFLTKKKYWQQREVITMHDLIHDLARSISIDEFCTITEENVVDRYTGAYHTYTQDYGILDRLYHRSLMRTVISNVAWNNCEFSDRYYHSNIRMYINLRVLKWNLMRDLEHITNFIHLRYLELNDGEIVSLPDSIVFLFNLVVLKLSNLGHLIELPIHIGKLFNLRFLAVHFVGIRELPESLGRLSNLQYLSVSSCEHLEKLPTRIGNLTSLKQLGISDLNIRELPESFCMLQNLQILSIDRCWNMTQIPSGIGDLTNLQQINCENSCFQKLPESMNNLCNLKLLKLGCWGSPVAFLSQFEGLLYRSSLNFSIRRCNTNGQPYIPKRIISRITNYKKKCQIEKADTCEYVKTERMMSSILRTFGNVKLEINGYEGIGYAHSLNSNSRVVSIAVHCHVKSDNFLTELGVIPYLHSLSLVSFTGNENLWFDTSRFVSPPSSKVYFPYLKDLEFIDMSGWTGLIEVHDGHFPVLQCLKIENCPKLFSIPNFVNLRKLSIIRCSFSKLELNLLRSRLLESLLIGECSQLTVLQGLQNLNSLRALCVFRCPLLNKFMYEKLPYSPLAVEIIECPSLKDWSRIQQFNYIEEFPCDLAASGTVNLPNGNQNILIEFSGIPNCIKLDQCLNSLTSLEIRSCRNLMSLDWLNEVKLLRSLVLWDCPLLQLEVSYAAPANLIQDFKPIGYGGSAEIRLPTSLQSLAVHQCYLMLSLNLRVENGSSLTELEVVDCKRLKYIRDIQKLTNLETLKLVRCPQLLLQPLISVPNHVVISRCCSLKGWCKWHSVELLDDEVKRST